jgi:hypothetical protein
LVLLVSCGYPRTNLYSRHINGKVEVWILWRRQKGERDLILIAKVIALEKGKDISPRKTTEY